MEKNLSQMFDKVLSTSLLTIKEVETLEKREVEIDLMYK